MHPKFASLSHNFQRQIKVLEKENINLKDEYENATVILKREKKHLNEQNTKLDSRVEDLTLKNRELMRQLAAARQTLGKTKNGNICPEIQGASSDSEVMIKRLGNSRSNPVKERKLKPNRTTRSTARITAKSSGYGPNKSSGTGRRTVKSSGFGSDRSGYASTDSDRSYGQSPARSRRSRPLQRVAAVHQRAVDNRLSSPKNPRVIARQRRQWQSASPRTRGKKGDPGMHSPLRFQKISTRPADPSREAIRGGYLYDADTEIALESFSDIDSRLNALQTFLQEAKATTGVGKEK